MSVNIHSIHSYIDNDLEEFIEKKVNKFLKLDNKIISFDIFLKLSKAEFYSNKITEI